MTRQRIFRTAALLLAVLTAVGVAAAASGSAGSSQDPLVTLSYLEEVYTPAILDRAEQLLKERDEQLEKTFSAQVKDLTGDPGYGSFDAPAQGTAVTYVPVSLAAGQALTLSQGAEVMLRGGSATGSSGLADTTGGSFGGGALAENHLYLSTQDGQTVTGSGTLLVRGSYQVQ